MKFEASKAKQRGDPGEPPAVSRELVEEEQRFVIRCRAIAERIRGLEIQDLQFDVTSTSFYLFRLGVRLSAEGLAQREACRTVMPVEGKGTYCPSTIVTPSITGKQNAAGLSNSTPTQIASLSASIASYKMSKTKPGITAAH